MAYTKQNFVDGQTLKAEHLNKIEDGIDELDAQISQLSSEKVDISDIAQESGQSETLVMSQKAVTNLVAGAQSGGSGLPSVNESDNGKTVKVVDGSWSVEQMSYNDLLDKPSLFSGNYNDLTNLPVYDTTPTSGSTNPVTSGGLFNKFTEHEEQINTALAGAHSALSGALTWDGVIGNKEVIILDSNEESTVSLVHVSDEYPEILSLFMGASKEEGPPCTVAISGLHAMFMGTAMMTGSLPMSSDGFVGGEMFFIVPSDNYTPPEDIGIPFTFPKKGVYFIHMILNEMAALGLSAPAMYVSALSLAPFHSFADSSGGDASKYFEEKMINNDSGDTLTWDGDTKGLEKVQVTFSTPSNSQVINFYKISDSVLTPDDVINGIKYPGFNGSFIEKNGEEAQQIFEEDGLLDMLYWVNIPYDNYALDDSIHTAFFPKAGIYQADPAAVNGFICNITVNGYNFTTSTTTEIIKTKHLPPALRFGEITSTIESDTLTWDGNTEGLENLDGAYFHVSDVVPTLNDIHQGFSITMSNMGSGENETVSISAEEAASITLEENGVLAFDVMIVLTLPLTYTMDDGTTIRYPAGVYFGKLPDAYISSFTINNYKGFTTTNTKLVKIDKKYLPDDIGGGSGLPEVSAEDNGKTVKVVDGEWSVEKLSYNDLSDKPTLGTLASKNSLSASDVGAATIADVNSAIEAAIGAAIAASY